MLIGFALIPLFFFWETRIDPKVWKIRNAILISVISLLPYACESSIVRQSFERLN
jgi:hypothetical protein